MSASWSMPGTHESPASTNTTFRPGNRSNTPPKVSCAQFWRKPCIWVSTETPTAPGSAVGIASPMWKARGRPDCSTAAHSGSIRGWLYWMVRPSAYLPGLIGIIRQLAPSSAHRATLSAAASGAQ